MASTEKVTAGMLAQQASLDSYNYSPVDLAMEWTKSIEEELWKCVEAHKNKIDEKEFCVVMSYADDCVLSSVIRRKFYAWPFLPKPRPRQSVWLYRKGGQDLQLLWSLPKADTMAKLGVYLDIPKEYRRMAKWVRAFYDNTFFDTIRKEAGITLESNGEFLKAHSGKNGESILDNSHASISDTFDFGKHLKTKVIDSSNSVV